MGFGRRGVVFGVRMVCGGARWRVGVLLVLMVVLVCCCVCVSVVFAAGDVNEAGCSAGSEASPGFSVSLPDCRAYEMVSPPYDGGEAPTGLELREPLISPDGEHVLSFDFAGFAGAENVEESIQDYLGVYVFSRTDAGWVPEAVDPPASKYPRSKLALNAGTASASSELDRTLWELDLPSPSGQEEVFHRDAARLAVREAGGHFKVLGPGVFDPEFDPSAENYTVVGSSADLSHILFRVEAGPHRSWPGDTTTENDGSLYEYTEAEGREPVLVGVSNEGALDGSPNVNDGARLISECGTKADGISEGGQIVYFTAEYQEGCSGTQPTVDELYARVGGEKTLAISEPPLQGEAGSIPGRECTGACVSEEKTARKPATFQGTADEGREVFFTSEQVLDNAAKPGVINLYEETIEGEGEGAYVSSLKWLAADVSNVAVISKDGTRVYFESKSALSTSSNANGEVALEGVPNLYVVSTETVGPPSVTFVVREPSLVREETSPGEFERTQAEFDTTANGEYLVFESKRDIQGTDDSSTARQLFEYDVQGGRVVRVSAGVKSPGGYECDATGRVEEGYNCDGNITSEAEAPAMVELPNSSLAEDGAVVFSSHLALTPEATSGYDVGETLGEQQVYTENVYEYQDGHMYVLSGAGEDPAANEVFVYPVTRLFGIDASGRDVFFATTQQLLDRESNSQIAWYDAREDGGFPPVVTASPCTASACQGSVPSPPVLPVLGGSTTGIAGQNTTPATPASPRSKPKTTVQIRAERLSRALKTCRSKRNKRKRTGCEARARRQYGPVKVKSDREGR
jgi:hypothetical protein